MESLKIFLNAIDIFGITYSFRYQQKERYQTILGGIIFLLFLILVFIVGIYYFIPFIKRKNYTIVYYTMNLAATEEVNLFQSESNFAVGVNCEDNKKEKLSVHDLLALKAKFISYQKQSNGTYIKYPKDIKIHKCNYKDFFNKYNNQVDYLGLSKYECLEDKEDIIQGIYTDKIFSYFEFTVEAKDDSLLSELDRFLFENDCKLQIVYSDIIIDLLNYKNPITQYLNEVFIQLNPTLFIKRNMFYMNQYFTNDDYLLFVLNNEKPEIKTLYSRYDEYFLYMGLERNKTRPHNYDKYVKVYMRADLKKTFINRRYQKFMEFYADASSILIALYEVLFVLFNFIDYFYAYHSLSKQIFFFKEIKEDYNYNIFQKRKEIEEIISLMDSKEKNKEINIIESNNKVFNNKSSNKIGGKDSIQELDFEKNNKEIIIYKNNNIKQDNKRIKKYSIAKKPLQNEVKLNTKVNKSQRKYNKKHKLSFRENDFNSEDYMQRNKISQIKQSNIMNIKSNEIIEHDANKEKLSSSSSISKDIKNNNIEKVDNNFNILEIFISQLFSCCMSKSMV